MLIKGVLWQVFYFYSMHAAQLNPKMRKAVGDGNASNDRLCLDKQTARSKPVRIDDSLYLLNEEDFLRLAVDFILTSSGFM